MSYRKAVRRGDIVKVISAGAASVAAGRAGEPAVNPSVVTWQS
jgi:hypothetical protein